MTAVEQIRVLCQDSFRFDSAEFYGDAQGTKQFKLPFSPIKPDSYSLYIEGVRSYQFTLDCSTGVVTLDAAPPNGIQCVVRYLYSIFTDDEMGVFYTLENDDVRCAAALAYETIAGNMALTLKVIKLLDLQTDGQKTAQGLLAVAERLRKTAGAEIDFDIAEQIDIWDAPALREKRLKDMMREGL